MVRDLAAYPVGKRVVLEVRREGVPARKHLVVANLDGAAARRLQDWVTRASAWYEDGGLASCQARGDRQAELTRFLDGLAGEAVDIVVTRAEEGLTIEPPEYRFLRADFELLGVEGVTAALALGERIRLRIGMDPDLGQVRVTALPVGRVE